MGLSFLFIRVLEGNRISSEHSFFFSATKHNRLHQYGSWWMLKVQHAQLRWKPFSIVAARRRSLIISSEEYSGSFK